MDYKAIKQKIVENLQLNDGVIVCFCGAETCGGVSTIMIHDKTVFRQTKSAQGAQTFEEFTLQITQGIMVLPTEKKEVFLIGMLAFAKMDEIENGRRGVYFNEKFLTDRQLADQNAALARLETL